MPGSSTPPGRQALAMTRLAVLPSAFETESAPGNSDFVAQWLAYALPYRRFVDVLANGNARLGADVDRYSFIVSDFHRLLLAGLPAHFEVRYAQACSRSLVENPAFAIGAGRGAATAGAVCAAMPEDLTC